PDNDEDYAQLDFSEFDLADGDELKIYNSDSADPDYLIDTYSNSNPISGVIKATSESPSHCLTLVFQSNGSGTAAGFEAEISCANNDIGMNLQNNDGVFEQCSGTFRDHLPADNLYHLDADESQVITICSDDPDLVARVEFNDFKIPPGYHLTAYDGNST